MRSFTYKLCNHSGQQMHKNHIFSNKYTFFTKLFMIICRKYVLLHPKLKKHF